MGVCREFGPQIHPDCEHPMLAGADSCTCTHCGTRCTGRFPACSQVWQRGSVAVAVRAPEREVDPEPGAAVDDTLPDLWDSPDLPPYVPPRRARGAPWARRRFPAKVPTVATLAFLGGLLLFAVVTSSGRERPDRLSVTDQTQVTAPTTTTETAAPLLPPAPTTLPEPPTTSAPPPPSTVAPPPPRPARAAPPPAPARRPARAAPAPTVERFPRMCGFTPGSPVDVVINGRPSGAQTADRNGCVSRPGR